MDKHAELQTFVQVVQQGSFSAAAKRQGMTPSATSRAMKRLEDRLGVRLVDRTTRRLRLTPEGRVFHARATRILDAMREAEQAVLGMNGALRGRVRVNASVPLANHRLIPLLPHLCRQFPGLQLDLTLSDDLVDVLDVDADVVLRVGTLQDSSLTARRLGVIRRYLVAAPSYLERAGIPRHPEDLADHECLAFNLHRGLNAWRFRIDGRIERVPVQGRISVNNGESMRYLALNGVGIARLGEFLVGDDIREGRLVSLLEPFNPGDESPVHALFPSRENLPARVRAFIDFLAEHLGDDAATR